MALEKSEPNSSLWASSDALQGRTDAEIAALEAKLTKTCQVEWGMRQELLTGKTRLM